MKKSPLFLIILLCSKLWAYDLDTHFYGTYSLARFAGIKHEVASKIATGAQWMDESYISDPMSMILLPEVGIKKRRLLHFPGTRLANKLTVDTLPSFLDPSSGVKLKTFTETEADHEFATELFTEGLMQGNLMKVSAGLHTLEDSFAHAGTISELGHAHFWHHPDRPYADDESIEKYFKMCRSVLKAMVAIRSLLPMDAIDMKGYFSTIPNYNLNGDQLADIYEKIPMVRQAISKKTLLDPNYVKFALENVFKRAEKAKYLKSGYESYLNQFTAGQDTYQAAESIVQKLPPSMVDISSVLRDSGNTGFANGSTVSSDYILSMGGISQLLSKVIRNLLTGIVPRPMNAYHRFEKEEDGPLWVKELDLRVANMRYLIFNMYNQDIFFVKNSTSSSKGFIEEINLSEKAKPVMPARASSVQFITYSVSEKAEFNQTLFSFLFPKLNIYLQKDMKKIIQYLNVSSELIDKGSTVYEKISDTYGNLVMQKNKNTGSVVNIVDVFKIGREDIYQGHIVPHELNRFFTVPELVLKKIQSQEFKSLLSQAQLKNIEMQLVQMNK